MTFPTLELDGNFNDETAYSANVVENRMSGDAVDRGFDRINRTGFSQSLNAAITSIEKKQEVEALLKSSNGSNPFYYKAFEADIEGLVLYTCPSCSFEQKSPDVWLLQAELVRAFRLKT